MKKTLKYRMAISIIIPPLFFIQPATAETKLIVCENSLGENYLEYSLKFNEEECSKNNQFACKTIAGIKRDMETCRASGVRWSHHKEFLFDTRSLKSESGYAEYFTETCWGDTSDVERVLIKSTPSVITFIKPGSNPFNVDRKTLQAGFKLRRDYQCRIKNPDTSHNKI